MHGKEADPRTDLNVHKYSNMYMQIRIVTGKAHVSVKLVSATCA